LAVKTASEMTYCVSGGALNSTHSLTPSKQSDGNNFRLISFAEEVKFKM